MSDWRTNRVTKTRFPRRDVEGRIMAEGTAVGDTIYLGPSRDFVEPGAESAIVRRDKTGKPALRIEWANIGEGEEGDFDPDDPGDTNYLRFYILEWRGDHWAEVENGSFCTQFPASATPEQQVDALRFMMDLYYPEWETYNNSMGRKIFRSGPKHAAQRLSWISPERIASMEDKESFRKWTRGEANE